MDRRLFLCLIFIVCKTVIVDLPGVSYTAQNEYIELISFSLQNYQTVQLTNNTIKNTNMDFGLITSFTANNNSFYNNTIWIKNITNSIIYSNTFVDSLITIHNITNLNVHDNTWTGLSSSRFNSSQCYEFKNMVEYHAVFYSASRTLHFNNNRYIVSGEEIYGTWFNLTDGAFVSLSEINNNTITLTYVDPFNKTTIPFCEQSITNNLSNGSKSKQTPFGVNLLDSSVNTFYFIGNSLTVVGTGATLKTLHSQTTFIYDSLINVIGLSGTGSLSSNVVTLVGYSSLFPPVRTGILLTNTTVNSIKTFFSITTTQKYQYIAKYISDLNSLLNPYTFKVQIEPNYNQDEFNGWDECHYACKRFCDKCMFTDGATTEFSVYVDDICLNKQVFNYISNATRLCRHDDLVLTGPYTSNDALLFSSKNKISGKLNVTKRDTSAVVLSVNDGISISTHYKYTLSQTKYTADPNDIYFQQNHPFLIITEEKWENTSIINLNTNAIMKELYFDGITIILDTTGATRQTFSTFAESSVSYDLNKFVVTNSVLNAYSGSQLFTIGYSFLNRISAQNYSSSVGVLKYLEITKSVIYRMDGLIDSIEYIPEIKIQNNTMFLISNGLINSQTQLFQYSDNICNDCFPNGITGIFLKMIGINTTTSFIQNNIITSSAAATTSLSVRTYHIENFTSIQVDNNVNAAKPAIGLFFNNIGSYPCKFESLVTLENINPSLDGNVHDFFCGSIGCKDDSCYNDITLAPPFCIVNKTYPLNYPKAKIVYFNTIQDAIDKCLTSPIRYIYIMSDFYPEVLTIHNKYLQNETLVLLPYTLNGRYLVVGADHSVTSTSIYNIEIDGMDMINPLGLLAYTASRSSNMLVVTSTDIIDFSIKNANIYSVQPITPITALPTTYAGWTQLTINLTTKGTVHPNIRAPNTLRQLNIKLSGDSLYQNINLYGSDRYGLYEQRLSHNDTTLYNINGENQWGSFIGLAFQWDLMVKYTNCSYFCGGLSTSTFALTSVQFDGGRSFYYYNNTISLGVDPAFNPYVTTRMPVGKPFLGFGNVFLGYLAGVHIYDMTTVANWAAFKFRDNHFPYNETSKIPIVVRLENVDSAVAALNDDYILFNDPRRVARQIQYQNNILSPTTDFSGAIHDVKIGPPSQDNFLTSSNYCDNLCIPISSQQLCTVDLLNPISLFNFHSLQTAISSCQYGLIMMMSATHYESITTNFVYTTRQLNTLTILSYFTTTTIYGNHVFLQDCTPSQTIPTAITFHHITFKPLVSTGSIITVTPSVSTCIYQELVFSQTKFILNSTFSNMIDGYSCEECTVNNITFSSNTFTGPFKTVINIKNLYSLAPNVNIIGTIVDTAKTQALTVYSANTVNLRTNNFKCEAETTTSGCIYLYNIQTYPIQLYSNTITSDVLNSTILNNAITIQFLPTYTLSQLGSITSGILLETTDASQYGMQLIISDIDSEYPCNSTRIVYIQALGANNMNIKGAKDNIVITDQSGIIIGYILSGALGLDCLVFNGIPAVAPALAFYAILAGAVIIIIIIIFIGCFDGLAFIYKPNDWNVSSNTDLVKLEANKRSHEKTGKMSFLENIKYKKINSED